MASCFAFRHNRNSAFVDLYEIRESEKRVAVVVKMREGAAHRLESSTSDELRELEQVEARNSIEGI